MNFWFLSGGAPSAACDIIEPHVSPVTAEVARMYGRTPQVERLRKLGARAGTSSGPSEVFGSSRDSPLEEAGFEPSVPHHATEP